MKDIPYGYCHCGCEQEAPIATYSHSRRGWTKGNKEADQGPRDGIHKRQGVAMALTTRKIPVKLLRALKVLACMEAPTLMRYTCFTFDACNEAIKTAQEYCQSGRMDKEPTP